MFHVKHFAPWDRFRRILVVRTDHLGDLVCSTPFLRWVRQAAPQAEIHALVPRGAAAVLQENPNVNWVLHDLERFHYDCAVALSPRSKTYRLVHSTRASVRIGYVYRERLLNRFMCRYWLTHPVELAVRADMDNVPHEVEQHAIFAREIGLEPEDCSLEFPAADVEFGATYQDQLVVHFSAGWLTHGWTAQDFVRLCRLVGADVVTYGPLEAEMVGELRELPLLGGITVQQWAGVLGAARGVISPDTGAVHVAAARGTPVVVVYQPEHFQLCSQQWHPWQVPHHNVSKGEPEQTTQEIVEGLRQLGRIARTTPERE